MGSLVNCKQCEKALLNPRALYCSDKCRMRYKRKANSRPEQDVAPEQVLPEQSEPEQVTRTDLSGVLYEDLYLYALGKSVVWYRFG